MGGGLMRRHAAINMSASLLGRKARSRNTDGGLPWKLHLEGMP